MWWGMKDAQPGYVGQEECLLLVRTLRSLKYACIGDTRAFDKHQEWYPYLKSLKYTPRGLDVAKWLSRDLPLSVSSHIFDLKITAQALFSLFFPKRRPLQRCVSMLQTDCRASNRDGQILGSFMHMRNSEYSSNNLPSLSQVNRSAREGVACSTLAFGIRKAGQVSSLYRKVIGKVYLFLWESRCEDWVWSS